MNDDLDIMEMGDIEEGEILKSIEEIAQLTDEDMELMGMHYAGDKIDISRMGRGKSW